MASAARPSPPDARRRPPERLSRVDTAWLRMDGPAHPMTIVGLWWLAPTVPLAALRERLRTRLLRHDRFRQRVVVDDGGEAWWVEDRPVDLRRHVRPAPLACRDGETPRQALQRLCGALASTPLDPGRPLWQVHLVDGGADGGALVVRVHHCIADGAALVAVAGGVVDGGDDADGGGGDDGAGGADGGGGDDGHDGGDGRRGGDGGDAPAAPAVGARGRAGDGDDGRAAAGVEAGAGGEGSDDGATAGPQDGLVRAVLRPLAAIAAKALGAPEGLAQAGWRLAGDAAALAALADDAPTRLKGPLEGRRVVGWSEPLPLADVKAVARALGCTVNDVLLAAVAGALGGWLRAQGDDPAGLEIRALVPVDLRRPDERGRLGNRFGLVPLALPIGAPDPLACLAAVHRAMAASKQGYQPLLSLALLTLGGLVAEPVQERLFGLFAAKATAVVSNVPGPPAPLALCGSALRQSLFWVPAAGGIGVGVSLLSYAGGVQMGLVTDRARCAEPQAVCDGFEAAFDALLWLTLMRPWGDDGGA